MATRRILGVFGRVLLYGAVARFGLPVTNGWAKSAASSSYVYLAEEPALVPGRPNRMISRYISETGLTQAAEIIDNTVVLFDERQVNTASVFALLSPLIVSDRFPIRKRSESVSGLDGLYPPYERLFFGFQDKQTALYAGLISAAPDSVARLVQKIHAVCGAPSSLPQLREAMFFQAALLDSKTADEFRQRQLLRQVSESELASAPVSSAALHDPFQLISASATEARSDSLTTQLSDRQPVLYLEYAGVAFQLTRLKHQKPIPPL